MERERADKGTFYSLSVPPPPKIFSDFPHPASCKFPPPIIYYYLESFIWGVNGYAIFQYRIFVPVLAGFYVDISVHSRKIP